MPPSALTVSSRARSISAKLVTSTAMAATRPRSFSSSAVFSESFLSRSQIATAAPDSRNRSTTARPIPCAPPVTTAFLPLRSILLDIVSPYDFVLWCKLPKRRSADEGAARAGAMPKSRVAGRFRLIYDPACGACDGRPAFQGFAAQSLRSPTPFPSFTEETHVCELFSLSNRTMELDRHRPTHRISSIRAAGEFMSRRPDCCRARPGTIRRKRPNGWARSTAPARSSWPARPATN